MTANNNLSWYYRFFWVFFQVRVHDAIRPKTAAKKHPLPDAIPEMSNLDKETDREKLGPGSKGPGSNIGNVTFKIDV